MPEAGARLTAAMARRPMAERDTPRLPGGRSSQGGDDRPAHGVVPASGPVHVADQGTEVLPHRRAAAGRRRPGDALTYREHVWQRDRYEALFAPARPGTLRGESTPLYLYDRAALRRVAGLIPAVKLIVILRDPVERAHSNWTHLWSAGLEPVGDFVQACAEEERRIAAGWAHFWHHTGLGRYGTQLDHAFSLFHASRCW